MSKAYNTVGNLVKIDADEEKDALNRIMAVSGNVFSPAADEFACPSRHPENPDALADVVDEVDAEVEELESLAKELADNFDF